MPSQLPFEIPAGLLEFGARSESWASWLEALPRLVVNVVDDWALTYDGEPAHGFCALVVPVRTAEGVPAVVKLAWPHDEEEHEHLALQALHGDGTVRLYRADPHRHAMLLERLHRDRDLTGVDELAACAIVAGFYPRIHIPALPQLRTLTSYIQRWNADMEELPTDAPLPRRLVEQATALARDFVVDPASAGTMIHGDLHYENVLAADREPWLVIDPKPMSGDPHYEVAPLLWNRWDEVVSSGDVRTALRRRFHTVVDAAGLDEERARDWVVVRMMHNAMWQVLDASAPGLVGRRRLSAEDVDAVNTSVTVAKAVQD
ncbi:MAG: aminoglycoside phosphotransferase family protein [Nocardioidaceae bacterium]